MATEPKDDGTSERSRRAPPTIDLDPSEVSGDSLRANAGRARWTRMMDDLRGHAWMPQSGMLSRILPGVLSFAGGLAAILLIAALVWAFGWPRATPSATEPQRAALDDIASRLARLEQRPAAPAPANAPSSARVDAVEAALNGLKDNLASLQKSEAANTQALAELKNAPRPATQAAPDLAPLTERLSRLEQVARSDSAVPSADAKLRLGVIALALDTMIRRGDPFVDILNSAKQAGVSAAVLAPLDAFASSGVPDDVTLSRQLLQLLPQLAPAPVAATKPATQGAAPPESGGWLDRLKAGATGLVSVERVEEGVAKATAPRDERALILARVKTAAERNDVATAQRELQRLPDEAREAAKAWLDLLARRDTAREAARKLVAASIAGFNDAVAR